MSDLWAGRRAPVTLLGGYLGSGKTTLLNELLASADRKYAVLVNDVGTVNVDAALVASRDGDTIDSATVVCVAAWPTALPSRSSACASVPTRRTT